MQSTILALVVIIKRSFIHNMKTNVAYQLAGQATPATHTIDLGNGAKCKIYASGNKYWFLNDERHRTDGPAIEYADGSKYWYINGKEYSEADFDMIKEILWAL